jgi:hypothetical protein
MISITWMDWLPTFLSARHKVIVAQLSSESHNCPQLSRRVAQLSSIVAQSLAIEPSGDSLTANVSNRRLRGYELARRGRATKVVALRELEPKFLTDSRLAFVFNPFCQRDHTQIQNDLYQGP